MIEMTGITPAQIDTRDQLFACQYVQVGIMFRGQGYRVIKEKGSSSVCWLMGLRERVQEGTYMG